ncbi:hypothetical protein B7463_g12336, partial [Scytalidium lignicola]
MEQHQQNRPRKMNEREDDARPAKRRRFSNVNDHQTQVAKPAPPRTQPYLSLVASRGPLPEPAEYNEDGVGPAKGAHLFASANRYASQERLGRVEREPEECCYGMVRRRSIASKYRGYLNPPATYLNPPKIAGVGHNLRHNTASASHTN